MKSRHGAPRALYEVTLERTARVTDHPGGGSRAARGLRRVVDHLVQGTVLVGIHVYGLHQALSRLTPEARQGHGPVSTEFGK